MLQYFGHLMWRADSLGKILMLGKIEGRGEGDDRGQDCWMASLTRWTWVWASSRRWWWRTGKPGVLQSTGSQSVRCDWVTEQQQAQCNSNSPVRSSRVYKAYCMHVLSHFSHVWLFATPWTVDQRSSLSMGFSRQEYWSGLPFPLPGVLPNPGIECASPALQADSLPTEPLGKPSFIP